MRGMHFTSQAQNLILGVGTFQEPRSARGAMCPSVRKILGHSGLSMNKRGKGRECNVVAATTVPVLELVFSFFCRFSRSKCASRARKVTSRTASLPALFSRPIPWRPRRPAARSAFVRVSCASRFAFWPRDNHVGGVLPDVSAPPRHAPDSCAGCSLAQEAAGDGFVHGGDYGIRSGDAGAC